MLRLNKHRAGGLLILLLAFVSPLYSGGREETTDYTMADADALIEARDYNKAIEVLIALSKQDPEYFEQTQEKVRFIRTIRDSYNDTYEELINVLFVEGDYEQALEIIKELDALDSNPNEATRTAIRDARISAELIYFKQIFNEIMDQALIYLTQGEYLEAINLYETGFILFRQTFDENPYGDLLKDPVYRALDDLTLALAEAKENWDDYGVSQAETDALIEGNQETLASVNSRLMSLGALRNRIYEASVVYERQNQLIREGNDGVEDFYLSFMNRLLAGRLTSGEWEGIAVALDYQLEEGLDKAAGELKDLIDSDLESALYRYSLEEWNGAETALARVDSNAASLDSLYGAVSSRIYLEADKDIDRLGGRITDKYYDRYRENRNRREQVEFYNSLIALQTRMDLVETNFSLTGRDEYPGQRADVVSLLQETSPLAGNLEGISESLSLDPLIQERSLFSMDRSEEDLSRFIGRGNVLEADIVVAMADWDIITPETLLEEFEARLALDGEYISGYGEGEGDDLIFRYPQRALSDLALLDEQMISFTAEARDYRDTYRSEQEEIYDGTLLASYLDRIDRILERSVVFIQDIALLREDGENFIYLAQKDFNAGEFRYNQAVQQLNNSNFQLARDELNRAQELYVSALSYDEDSFDRDDLDARIAALQARILDEENKKVIRDVRELINQGKSLYFQGLYAQSEARLIQAENKWFTTNTEENSELVYWMSLVRTALSVESGRYLEESNPLYNEITQLLNLAWKKYKSGLAYLEDNKRIEGINDLNRSDDYLNQVRILMPLNQNASVLKLRVLKALDEDNFSVTFAEMYQGALQKSDFQTEQAYIELKDLAEIIPDYPGIQNNILALEYDLGIKIPPPDPAKLRESTRLYNSAKAIFDSGSLNLFAGAIEQLGEAISLNPNNTLALSLIDQMRLYEGSSTTAVLPSAALALYQSAEEKFVAGEYLSSYQVIQELWTNSSYRSYPPLQELKRRVEAKLGL